jgi:putative peptidoglycan lipid II flippase
MLVSLGSIVVNFATAETMFRLAGLGHAGLALSTSVVALFGFFLLFEILRRRIGGVHGRELASGIGKVLIASLVMAGITALSSHGVESWLGASQMARLADLAISLPVGLAVFYGMCRALGVHEVDMAISAFTYPVQRRLRRKNTP